MTSCSDGMLDGFFSGSRIGFCANGRKGVSFEAFGLYDAALHISNEILCNVMRLAMYISADLFIIWS